MTYNQARILPFWLLASFHELYAVKSYGSLGAQGIDMNNRGSAG